MIRICLTKIILCLFQHSNSTMLERVKFSVVFVSVLQVLNQLNLFAEDDVDSAAEALNDVSFCPLRRKEN